MTPAARAISNCAACPGLGPQYWLKKARVQSFEPSALDEIAQAGKSGIPLLRDQVEVAARVLKTLLIQVPDALASAPRAARKTRVLHKAQMLRDGLTCDAGTRSECADGRGSFVTKANDQP